MKPKSLLKVFSVFLASSLGLASCGIGESHTSFDRSALPDSLKDISFEEHLDISIGYWNVDNMVKAQEPDGLTRYIEELFNITIHPVSVTWSNYKERYKILGATNSLPDIFATLTLSSNDNNDSATFIDMIETNSIRSLPEDLSAFPILDELLESVSYTKYTDNRYYAIPRVSFLDPGLGATDAAMLVRRDWMDSLGISDPETFEEFAAMAAAFAGDDPDGNGMDDTIGYNVNNLSALGKWVMLSIAPECNVYSWVDDNGKYVPAWTTDNFKKVVSSFRTLYETGALDPQFYTKTPTTVAEDFAAGRLGALEYKSSPDSLREIKEIWDVLNDKPFEECVDVLPVPPAPDGVRYSNSSSIFWSESFISSSVDEVKAQRILSVFEFLLSKQGQELCHYGLEGEDYIKKEDGSLECLVEIIGDESLTTALMRKYPSFNLIAGIATWRGGWADFEENELNNLRYGADCVRLANKSATWFAENTTQLTRPYAFLIFPKEPTDLFSTSQAFDKFISCIIGNGDPVRMWELALRDMEEKGLQEYIDRQNENFNKRN